MTFLFPFSLLVCFIILVLWGGLGILKMIKDDTDVQEVQCAGMSKPISRIWWKMNQEEYFQSLTALSHICVFNFGFWALTACWHEFIIPRLGFRFVRADKPFKQPLNSCDCCLQSLGSRICAWGCHIARCAERHFPTLSRYFEAMREAICIHIGQGGAMFSLFNVWFACVGGI